VLFTFTFLLSELLTMSTSVLGGSHGLLNAGDKEEAELTPEQLEFMHAARLAAANSSDGESELDSEEEETDEEDEDDEAVEEEAPQAASKRRKMNSKVDAVSWVTDNDEHHTPPSGNTRHKTKASEIAFAAKTKGKAKAKAPSKKTSKQQVVDAKKKAASSSSNASEYTMYEMMLLIKAIDFCCKPSSLSTCTRKAELLANIISFCGLKSKDVFILDAVGVPTNRHAFTAAHPFSRSFRMQHKNRHRMELICNHLSVSLLTASMLSLFSVAIELFHTFA
jgi:hypothetical protein